MKYGNTDKIKKAKIILAYGGAFVGDHANVKPIRRNIANRAVKQMRKIIFGILKFSVSQTTINHNYIREERK